MHSKYLTILCLKEIKNICNDHFYFLFHNENRLQFYCSLKISGPISAIFLCFYRYIIGKKGETRKRLESDTKTSISIPKQGVEGQIGKKLRFDH